MSNVVALTFKEYKHKFWQRAQTLGFATQDNFSPLSINEIYESAASLPIVFIRQEESFLLAALQGLNLNQNLFLNDKNMWSGMYCPEGYSYYPFCIADHDGKGIVCERTGSDLISETSRGNAFFDDHGEKSSEFNALIQELTQYHNGLNRAAELTKELVQSELLIEWPIEFERAGKKTTLRGVHRIDESKLNTLSYSQFGSLRDSGALAICYGQLVSMFNLKYLKYLHSIKGNTANIDNDSLDFDSGGSLNFDNL